MQAGRFRIYDPKFKDESMKLKAHVTSLALENHVGDIQCHLLCR